MQLVDISNDRSGDVVDVEHTDGAPSPEPGKASGDHGEALSGSLCRIQHAPSVILWGVNDGG
jgi:hypothetical protein